MINGGGGGGGFQLRIKLNEKRTVPRRRESVSSGSLLNVMCVIF